jgi:hypothetical protein
MKVIGYAEMADDGTIQLFLRSEAEDGLVGHGLWVLSPGDEGYPALLERLQGLEPGKRAAVPEWPAE